MDSLTLPIEIIFKILEYVSPETLSRVASVSKEWSSMACNNQLWWNHCWKFISRHLFILPLPKKEPSENYKDYFLKLKRFCSAESIDWKGYDFTNIKVGRETWERIDDINFKHMVYELRYAFPSYAIDNCDNSQIDIFLHNIICFKRNDGDLEKFLGKTELSKEIENTLFDIAYDPYAHYKPQEGDYREGDPMSSPSKYKKLTFSKFINQFKDLAPTSHGMQLNCDSYDNAAIFVANFAINKFLRPTLETLLFKEASEFSSFYPRFAKFFFTVLKQMNSMHNDSTTLKAGEKIEFDAITTKECESENIAALVRKKRLEYAFDSSNASRYFEYDGMYLSPANDFLYELLNIAIDEFIKFDFILDKTSVENKLRSQISDFIADFLDTYLDPDLGDVEYYDDDELIKNESLMMLCSSLCITNFQTISTPIMERICKLLFNVEIKDFFGLNRKMAKEIKNKIRYIELTDIENNHEAHYTKLFISENYAVIVYDHSDHC